ncbi:hypothetical protein JL722_4595 [Aureococcus anophagefferens]|nr:hypothetical protein JL722_4595 [Aureococcus anophagefferens]
MVDVSELSQRVLQLTLDDEPAQLRAALQDLEPEDERGFAATTDEGAYATHIAANFGRFHCLAELLDRGCPALRMPSGHAAHGRVPERRRRLRRRAGGVLPEDVRAFTGRGHTQRPVAVTIFERFRLGKRLRIVTVMLARLDRASGHTCLHAAAEAKHAACLRAVVAAAAAAPGPRRALACARRAAVEDGATALHVACYAGCELRAPLLPVSDVDARMRPPYASPLYVAAAGGYGACVAEILAHGGTAPAARGDHGPLHAAACSGDVECVARILAADAGALERRDPEARTPSPRRCRTRGSTRPSSSSSAARPVYAAPEVGSPDDVPVVDGAARAEVAVDLVDEAHAAPGWRWLREVDVFAGAAAGCPSCGALGRRRAGGRRDVGADGAPPLAPGLALPLPRGARRRAEAAAAVGWALERDGRRHLATIFTDAVLPYAVAREPGDLLSVADERRAYLLYLGGVVT